MKITDLSNEEPPKEEIELLESIWNAYAAAMLGKCRPETIPKLKRHFAFGSVVLTLSLLQLIDKGSITPFNVKSILEKACDEAEAFLKPPAE